MSEPDAPPARDPARQLRSRRRRDLGALLPLTGLLLLVTPVLTAIATRNGEPDLIRTAVYVFGVWALLILAAALLSRRRPESAGDGAQSAGTEAGQSAGPAPGRNG